MSATNPSTSQRNVLNLLFGLVLAVPALFSCGVSLLLPTLETFSTSPQKSNPLGREAQFVGLENLTHLFQDAVFSGALRFTLMMIVVRLLVVAIVPLAFAIAVSALGGRGRAAVRLLFTIPLALYMPVALALSWAMALAPSVGFWGTLGRGWLSNPASASLVLLAIDGLITLGLACGIGLIFFLGALRVPQDETWPRNRVVKSLAATWGIGMLAVVALTLQSFTLSYTLTGGGPQNATSTLALALFNQYFRNLAFGTGAATASILLASTMLLGLCAGLLIVLTRLQVQFVPRGKGFALMAKKRNLVLLIIALVLGAGALVGTLPLAWTVPNMLAAAPSDFRKVEQAMPMARTLLNTFMPLVPIVLVLQLPIAYVAALGIGGLRPLGKWSEILLLPFSPWLFVMVTPLSIAAFQNLRAVSLLNTLAGLSPPIWFSVPMLFILTLFFKGQATQFNTERLKGDSAVSAFFGKMILPSLPLAALLAFAGIFVGAQDLLWPLIVSAKPETFTMNLGLLFLRNAGVTLWPTIATAIALDALPMFLFAFLVFGAFQVLYLDRLAISIESGKTKQPG